MSTRIISVSKRIVTATWFEYLVLVAIMCNAMTLGLETYPAVMASYGTILLRIDVFFIGFFVCELALRLSAYGRSFWRDGWNWFDASVVTLTVLPYLGIAGLGNVSAFRAVRLLRVLTIIPSFKRVLEGIGRALAGSVAVMAVLVIILYVYAVISVKLFRDVSPERFADLHSAFFTYFQIMTLDAWSDIVRPIMEVYWWSGLFFMSFIITAVFILLSIIIGIASNAVKYSDER
jgi:voltage-gated sodium channel